MMNKKRVAVLISGRGSNMEALVKAASEPTYPAEIVLVLSNKSDAAGLLFAKNKNITTKVIEHTNYASREDFDAAIHNTLIQENIDIVCLAGFMRLLTPGFTKQWEGRMLNIHPSLLPDFKGAHAIRDALAAGVKETGCTVHFVTAEMDAGPIILQASCKVEPSDTEETLAARVLKLEHQCYPKALKQIAKK